MASSGLAVRNAEQSASVVLYPMDGNHLKDFCYHSSIYIKSQDKLETVSSRTLQRSNLQLLLFLATCRFLMAEQFIWQDAVLDILLNVKATIQLVMSQLV